MDGDTRYAIGDLARRTGLPVRTIRYYSDHGVLPPASRSPAGHRRYDLILRLRRAVLRAVARRGSGPEEMTFMHKAAKLSEAERHRLIHEFIDDTFGGVDANPELVALLRAAMPELPGDPTPEQVDAWIELAELVQDQDFRASVRVEAALAAGIDPASPQARPVLADLVGRYGDAFGQTDSREYRQALAQRLEVGGDPRAERYWQLLAAINGWPVPPSPAPAIGWFRQALAHHPEPSAP